MIVNSFTDVTIERQDRIDAYSTSQVSEQSGSASPVSGSQGGNVM